jgi:hypothetical protein
MNEKLIAYARLVSIAASQQQLSDEIAQAFCKDAVPQLLAELEVLARVNQRFDALLALPQAEPPRQQEEKKPNPKRQRKPRKKNARKK